MKAIQEKPSKSKFKLLVKLAISALLLAALYKFANKEGLLKVLSTVHVLFFVQCVCLYAAGQFVSVLKWNRLLQQLALVYPFRRVIRSYFFGMFVNTAALGTLGGDVARGVALKPVAGTRASVATSIVIDRAHGLVMLSLLGGIGSVAIGAYWYALPLLGGFAAALLFWWLSHTALRGLFNRYALTARLAQLFAAVLPRNLRFLSTISLLSLSLHILQISIHALMLSEFGADVPFLAVLAFVPLVNIASSLPFSVQGLGVRESMYALLFVPMYFSLEIAIGLGLLWFAVVATVNVLGGLFILLTNEDLRQVMQDSQSLDSVSQ